MRVDGPLTRVLGAVGGFLVRVPWPFVAVMWLGWAAVIFDLSSKSRPVVTSESPLWEFLSNLAHAPLFGTLALFTAALCLRQREGGWPRWRPSRAAAVVLVTMLYGLADEWHQSTVPGRDASLMDVLTDTVAAAMVVWVVHGLSVGE
ncbi:MAG: VanZ family protein, partial [Planctomycetota bacterium]